MPLRRTIGLSLAFLMISAGAHAKDRDRHPLHDPHRQHHHQAALHPHHPHHALRHERGRTAHPHSQRHPAHHVRLERHHRRTAAQGEGTEHRWGIVHPVHRAETGRAAWYRLVGGRTASGERLDDHTPTAAHRTLPLDSLARVTDLDNGRSIIVKINDRGPASHGLLIDLSPAAARMLHMKEAGIAEVRVQPLAHGPGPNERTATLAAYYDAPDD